LYVGGVLVMLVAIRLRIDLYDISRWFTL